MRSEQLRRRYALLSALLFTPTGLLLPVTAVLMRSRGLTLAQIGVVTASMSVVVLVLELPTGGLADVLGRRPLLMAASGLEVTAFALLFVARSPAAFAGAWCVLGASRALGSGPLEAWYVDAAIAADPAADIERGLAAGTVALSLAVAASGLGSAALVALSPGDVDPLLLPAVAALGAGAVGMVAVAVVVREPHRRLDAASVLAGVRGAPGAVRDTLAVVRRSRPLAALASVELLWGAGLTGIEMLVGPRLGDLLGGEREGVAAYGIAIAAGWTLSAVGAAATPRLTARVGSPARAGALLRVAQGLAALLMAVVAGPVALLVGYLAFYVVHGPSNAVHYGMVHRLTRSEHRTAMVSLNSLTARVGGVAGALVLGAVARAQGIPAAWVGAAVLLAVAAPLYLLAGRGRRVTGSPSSDVIPVLSSTS